MAIFSLPDRADKRSDHCHSRRYEPCTFQYVSGCRQSLNDRIMHAIDFVLVGEASWSTDTATWTKISPLLQRLKIRWWRPSSRVLARHHIVSGAAGQNRGGVAETPLLTRTHGRTADCVLTSLLHVLSQVGFLVRAFKCVSRWARGRKWQVVPMSWAAPTDAEVDSPTCCAGPRPLATRELARRGHCSPLRDDGGLCYFCGFFPFLLVVLFLFVLLSAHVLFERRSMISIGSVFVF